MNTDSENKFHRGGAESAVEDAIRLALLDKLEQELPAYLNTAMEVSAGSPPDGYDELTAEALRIADESWRSGMNSAKNAVVDWIYDQRNIIKPNA